MTIYNWLRSINPICCSIAAVITCGCGNQVAKKPDPAIKVENRNVNELEITSLGQKQNLYVNKPVRVTGLIWLSDGASLVGGNLFGKLSVYQHSKSKGRIIADYDEKIQQMDSLPLPGKTDFALTFDRPPTLPGRYSVEIWARVTTQQNGDLVKIRSKSVEVEVIIDPEKR